MNPTNYEFTDKNLGTIHAKEIDGDLWYDVADVCSCLGYSDVQEAVQNYVRGDDTRKIREFDREWNATDARLVNERGFLALIRAKETGGSASATRIRNWLAQHISPVYETFAVWLYSAPTYTEKGIKVTIKIDD